MNHSIATADRNTHLKIVVLSLVAAIMVVCVGITARLASSDGAFAAKADGNLKVGVVKAVKAPVAFTRRDDVVVR